MVMKLIYVSWRYLLPPEVKKLGAKAEKLRKEWVEDEGVYKRIVADYLVSINGLKKPKDLINELLDSLDEPIPAVDEIIRTLRAINDVEINYFAIWIKPNGEIETAYVFLEWFHGQELVNNLIEGLNFRIERDYDGLTKVSTRVSRPITHDKLCKAVKQIHLGLKLYYLIKTAQVNAAMHTTLSFIKVLGQDNI